MNYFLSLFPLPTFDYFCETSTVWKTGFTKGFLTTFTLWRNLKNKKTVADSYGQNLWLRPSLMSVVHAPVVETSGWDLPSAPVVETCGWDLCLALAETCGLVKASPIRVISNKVKLIKIYFIKYWWQKWQEWPRHRKLCLQSRTVPNFMIMSYVSINFGVFSLDKCHEKSFLIIFGLNENN